MKLGDGKFAFAAPEVDISSSIAKKRAQIAEQHAKETERARYAALSPQHAAEALRANPTPLPTLANAAYHGYEGAEAGFFGGPDEFSHNDAPPMAFAPPGYVEAGHRRPEDYDPANERAYAEMFLKNQIDRKMFMR